MAKRIEITIRTLVMGETKTLGKHIKEIEEKSFLFGYIVHKGILSKSKLEKAIFSGGLKETTFNNKRYIDKIELFNFLSKK